MMNKKILLASICILLILNNLHANDFAKFDNQNVYTLVNGSIMSPSRTARTIPGRCLKLGASLYYYQYDRNQDGILYFPDERFRKVTQDALVNVILEYGIVEDLEINMLLPIAPDWIPGYGGNRNGISDVTIALKYYAGNISYIDIGLSTFYKSNSSSYASDPGWYGTNFSNLGFRLILSTNRERFNSFINLGYKKILGSGKINQEDMGIKFELSNTFVAAFGFAVKFSKTVAMSFQCNYESHNKKNISGYYLDVSNTVDIELTKYVQYYLSFGKNISNYAPEIYFNSGITVPIKF